MKDFLEKTIREAGSIAHEYFIRGVEHSTKSNPTDFLTIADTTVSEFLVDAIHAQYPDHHIKSEELSADINAGASYEWIIDPVDGTRNFATGVPMWAVIIAIVHNGEPLHAAVYFPVSDQLFFASKGQGAYLNGKPIVVSRTDTTEYATGNVYRSPQDRGPYGDYVTRYRVATSKIFADTDMRCTNFGSAASFCFVANGALDFALGNSGLDWDYIAPFLICKEAGAIVTDSDGHPWKRGRQDYIIANPDIHPKIMKLFLP